MNKLVSINILTYNGQNLIEQCLKSVLNQTYQNIEVLIIDNASIDNTLKVVQKIRRNSDIQIVINKKNVGFAAGHNIGIKKSKGEYVLCLNQDVVLDKDFIKNTVKAIEKNKRIGSIQGKLYKIEDINNLKKEKLDTTGLLIFKNRRTVARGQGEEDKNKYRAGYIFGVDGPAPLYRKQALEDAKINDEYFDEDFFAYKEDVDLAWRMQLQAWKSYYEPKAIAYHVRGAGEKAVKNYVSVALARRKISKLAKFHSFKNDRLMRIKNELLGLFFRDILYILIKEMGAWAYVLIFEHYTWNAIKELFKQIPVAWKKRKIIMANKKANYKQMSKWFN